MDDGTDEMTDGRMESRVCTSLFSPPRRSKQTMTGRMDRGMTGRMTGRTDSGQALFLIPTSFTICKSVNPVPNAQVCVYLMVHITKLQLQTTFPKPLYIPHC